MRAIIKVNNVEVPESLVVVDTLSEEVTIQTPYTPEQKLDMNCCYVEVNIIGKLEV